MAPIYVTYSEEVRQALADADVNLPELVAQELASQGIQGQPSWASNPEEPEGSEKRELVLLILAAAAAAPLVASAVARVIDAVTKRQVQLKGEQSVDVKYDGQGRPVSARVSSKPVIEADGKEQHKLDVAKVFHYEYSRS